MPIIHLLRLCAVLSLLASVAFAGSAQAMPTPASKPNIIFVLIDDMGYGDLSCYGGRPGLTVHIDSLASEGIRFSQFYVGAPICSPSRTAFMTGQNPARWRITSFLAARAENERRGMDQWLDVKAPSLARTLQQAGYATGHFGKWHMGGQRDVGEAPLITEYGFDESLTNFEGLGDRILPLLDAFDGVPSKKYSLGSDNLGRGKIEWMDRSKVTGAFVQRTVDFVQRAEKEGKPFYVNLWPDDVHSPFFPPKALRGGASKEELYLSVTKAMDEQFAQLFDYVRNSPSLRTNTIILVASDNGPEPGAGSAGPFRGAKGMLYEGGIREPLIVWGPGFMEKSNLGMLNETTVISALDFFPSIARLAGVDAAGLSFDGEDISAALLGKNKKKRAKPLFWSRPPDRPGINGEVWPDLATRNGNWKLLLMRDGSNAQLFDLAKDPGETQNMAAKHPNIVQRMSEPLLAWWQSLPEGRLAGSQGRNDQSPLTKRSNP
ncbi:MAG: sulfatase-like hydrolase/transferase [Verrucomicrobia bacterium]|nr:sulfatase-like hydrolase/transferase [Verrucomicrobiota bacterium]